MSSVERAFQLVELLARHQEQGLTFPEIIAATQFPNSTLFRLLRRLTELNYLVYVPATRKYFLSLKFAGIGACITGAHVVNKTGHPFLEKLFVRSGHTCSLGVPDQDHGVYVDVLTTTRYGVKLLSEIGKSFPLHCTGLGKIMLAHMEPEQRVAVLPSPLPAYTEATITDLAVLERELEGVLRDGFAVDREEAFRGMFCIAAPVFDFMHTLIAAVSVSCPVFTLGGDEEEERLTAMVCETGAQISDAFGHSQPCRTED